MVTHGRKAAVTYRAAFYSVNGKLQLLRSERSALANVLRGLRSGRLEIFSLMD